MYTGDGDKVIISDDKRFVSTGDHENDSAPLFARKELLGTIDFAQLVITLNKTRYYLATLCENSDKLTSLRSTDFIIWRAFCRAIGTNVTSRYGH